MDERAGGRGEEEGKLMSGRCFLGSGRLVVGLVFDVLPLSPAYVTAEK